MIRFFNPALTYQKHKEEFDAEIQRVLNAGDLILRDDMEKFEKNLAEYIGTKYAIGLNSCTDALYLALRGLGIGQGDEVITSSHTFVATIQVIVQCGATPIFVDIKENGLMDMEEVEKKITEKTKAIIPVHITGLMCDIDELYDIIGDRNIVIIEDQAQAIGAR